MKLLGVRIINFFALTLLFVLCLSPLAFAQDETIAQGETAISEEEQEVSDAEDLSIPEVINPEGIPSLLFTSSEHATLRQVLIQRLSNQANGSFLEVIEEISSVNTQEERPKPPPESRILKLGGIVFLTDKEWIIWLNSKRITPETIPPEILDLQVQENHIEMRYYDQFTNQIFPVRLKSQQGFNLDLKIFLPG